MSASETAFGTWRRRRPLAAGILVLGAGAEMLVVGAVSLPIQLQVGLVGLPGQLVAGLLVLAGLAIVLQPPLHAHLGVTAVVLSLSSWVACNLGGFGAGLVMGLVGGGLAFAWRPFTDHRPESQSPSNGGR